MQGSARIEELRQKFQENPRRYFAPLANEYRKAGDPDQAIALCTEHLAQQPGHMSGHVVFAQALYDARRTVEARSVFEKALSLDPDNAIVLRQLGDIAREAGESSEARHWYARALDADPLDSEAAAYVAELTEPVSVTTEVPALSEQAAKDDAGSGAETADSEVPAEEAPKSSPFITRTMAELYAGQGHTSAALDVFRQLASANPDDREITTRIAELSGERGDEEGQTEGPTVAAKPQAGQANPVRESAAAEKAIEELAAPFSWEDGAEDSAGLSSAEANGPLVPEERSLTPIYGGNEPDLWPEDRGEDSPSVVAYAPEAPSSQSLAQFSGREPTVREFFATLGKARAPSRIVESAADIPLGTAGGDAAAAIAYRDAAEFPVEESQYAAAADAFASLFPDAVVGEADTRAAFAWSAALSGAGHSPSVESVQTSPPPAQVVGSPDPAHESEDELRQFRSWLDRLDESSKSP